MSSVFETPAIGTPLGDVARRMGTSYALDAYESMRSA
jgi:hypothetical protein